jgi:hypothetical protein
VKVGEHRFAPNRPGDTRLVGCGALLLICTWLTDRASQLGAVGSSKVAWRARIKSNQLTQSGDVSMPAGQRSISYSVSVNA